MRLHFLIFFILFFTSCGMRKNFVYFQGKQNEIQLLKPNFKIKEGDALGIKVFGTDQQSLDLFNIPGSQIQVQNPGTYGPYLGLNSYIVDKDGYIDFPVIGKIFLKNLNLTESTELIKLKLKSYISEPKVVIQVLNFKISVLGDVLHPGTYFITIDNINLIDAIAMAGDLNITGQRKNILLVRIENGIYKQYRIDLTKNDFVKSDLFYLQQNDVIYVESNQAKINSSKVSASWSIAITLASLVITTLNLISR
jgi:polysaccharide export outer membrane protein